MTAAKTANQRKAAERKRKRAAGLVPVEVWIPGGKKAELAKSVTAWTKAFELTPEEIDSNVEEIFRHAQQCGYSAMITKPDGSIEVIDPRSIFKDDPESDITPIEGEG